MRNKIATNNVHAYFNLNYDLTTRGLLPCLKRLENKAYNKLNYFLNTNNVDFQLAPPGIHCRNTAELDIYTKKIISLLASNIGIRNYLFNSVTAYYHRPLIFLNILYTSRVNSQISTCYQIHSAFD